MVEELYVRFRLHDEVGLQLRPLREERYVPVEDVYLLPLLLHERGATPHGEGADERAASGRRQDRDHGEPRLLCK